MASNGHILVVDDNKTSRLKLGMAVKNLGYTFAQAEDGASALDMLAQQPFDLILLDIVMPGLSGFEVLERLKADRVMREIPVLVISSMDDDMASVVKAIELGAEDFLPKTFDPVLLRARVTACISKKKHRDQELDYLKQVEALTDAACVLESGKFHPNKLRLEAVIARPDSLGQLARVFGDMAQQVYDRERSLQHNIRTLKGGLLLLLVGAMWGLMVPLTRVISRDTPEPIGASFWLELIAGLLCCAWAAMQGKLSRPSSKTWTFVCVWAILQGGSNVLMFLVAGHLPGIVISIVIALEGFAVFLFAAIMRIEESSLRRLLGLSLGLFGVAALLLASQRADGVSNWIWFAIALGIPMLYGAADLLVAARHPEGLDASFAMGLVLMVAAVFSLPLVLATDQFYFPGLNQGTLLLLGGGVLSAIGNVAYVFLIASTGAVFASQSAYAITAAGIAWSVMLLDESLTLWALGSLVLIIVGLALVGTKNEAGDVEVEFRRKRTRTA